jgi:FtsP/CotA-like multicopper oxidase with cupredoxin domain
MDGMWLNSVPGPATDTFSETNAGRLDIAVKCPSTIASTQFTWKTSSGNLPVDITIKAPAGTKKKSTSKSTDTPFGPDGGPWKPIRPWHMETTLDGPVERTITVQGAVNGIIWDGAAKSINDDPFVAPVLFYDKIYEFIITHPVVPDGRIHPIHTHIYPMQIYGKIDPETGKPLVGDCSGGTNLSPYKHGEFYDTVLSPDQCIVRWRSRGMGGKVMLHCHMLAHEDGGAMIYFNVEGGPDSYGIVPPVEPIACSVEGSVKPIFYK